MTTRKQRISGPIASFPGEQTQSTPASLRVSRPPHGPGGRLCTTVGPRKSHAGPHMTTFGTRKPSPPIALTPSPRRRGDPAHRRGPAVRGEEPGVRYSWAFGHSGPGGVHAAPAVDLVRLRVRMVVSSRRLNSVRTF